MKIATFFFIFVSIPTFNLLIAQSAQSDNTLLWKVSKEGSRTSYLYGTMHVRDPRAFDFADSVLIAFNSCDGFAMEVHPDSMNVSNFDQISESLSRNYYGMDDDKFRSQLGHETYDKIDNRIKNESGIGLNQLRNKSPRHIRNLLSESEKTDHDKATFLDMFLCDMAGGESKKIFGLESISKSYERLNAYQPDIRKQFETELQVVDQIKSWQNLIQLYQENKLSDIYALFSDSVSFDQEYKKLLLDERNQLMANSIDSITKELSCFIAVGCGHLPGPEGLVEILRRKGYTVHPVFPFKTGKSASYDYKFSLPKYQILEDKAAGYQIEFIGNPYPIKLPMNSQNMYGAFDYFKNIFTLSIGVSVPLEYENYPDNKFYEVFMERIVKERRGKIIKAKNVIIDGVAAREANVSLQSYPYKVALVRKNKMLFLLMMGTEGKDAIDAHFERFKNSFKTIHKNVGRQTQYHSKMDAFSVTFPGEPTLRDVPSKEEDQLVMRMYLSSDDSANVNFYVQVMELNDMNFIRNDSLILGLIGAGVINNLDKIVVEKDELGTFQGYNSRSMILTQNNVKLRMEVITRLNRIYCVFSDYKGENEQLVNDFYTSFVFTGYEPAEFTKVQLNEQTSISLPANYEKDTLTAELEQGLIREIQYVAKDKNSSAIYVCNHDTYSRLFSISDSTLLATIKNELRDEGAILTDSVETKTATGYELAYSITYPKTTTKKIVKKYLVGHELFSFTAYVSDDLKKASDSLFFSSFQMNPNGNEISLFEDKKENIKNEIRKPTLPLDELAEGIVNSHWEENDYPFLMENIQQAYPDDTTSYGGMNRALFTVLTFNDTVRFYEDMQQIYPKLTTRGKKNALRFTSQLRTVDAMKILANLMLSDTSFFQGNFNWYTVSGQINDSVALLQSFLPSILPLLHQRQAANELFYIMLKGIDSSYISVEQLEPYRASLTKHLKSGIREALEQKAADPDYLSPYWIGNALTLLFKQNWTDDSLDMELLSAIKKLDETWLKSILVTQFLIQGKIAPEEMMKEVFDHPYYQQEVYMGLAKHQKINLLPKKMQDPVTIAKSDIYIYAYDYGEIYPGEIKFLEKKLINHNGLELEFYLFVLTDEEVDEAGDKIQYFAMSGGYEKGKFSLGKKIDLTGIIWEEWQDVKKQSKVDLIKRCIEEREEFD